MKKVAFSCLLLFSTIFSACTSEEIKEDLYKTSDEVDKITVVLPQFDLDHSRTAITMGEYSDISSKWADGDSIGIYPKEGDQLSFRIEVEGDGKTCTFDGGGWALRPESSYTAYSPFKRSYYNQDKNRLQVNMLNQCQIGNESTAHLGAYDIKAAVGEKPTNGSLTFNMERKVALVRMELKASKAASWASVSLVSDAFFTTEAKLNLSLETPALESVTKANSVTLALSNVETTSDNLDIIAYMMLLPVDLTKKSLFVELTDNEGNVYKSIASVTNNKTNFAANGARWITADNFKLYEKPDYSWYTASDSYVINSAGQFLAFAKLVNGDTQALEEVGSSASSIDFAGKTVLLNKDISLGAYCGVGLGSWNSINGFKGTFDGGGNTISDLYCNHSGNMGLFGGLSNAVVKNLTVQGEINRTFDGNESSYLSIGGIASSASYTLFENCMSNVNITTSGTKNTSPISCTMGGICGSAGNSTFIACQSTSEISDDHAPKDWGYYIGGIVGQARYSNMVACCKLFGDVKELYTSSYSFVGGIVGHSSESSTSNPQNKYRACFTAINVKGRRPGLIVGATGDGYRNYDLNAIACYYSGTGSSNASGATYGIGNMYYGGYEVSYDSGTVRSVDLAAEVQTMNNAISTWNAENPDKKCNYSYINGNNGLALTSN